MTSLRHFLLLSLFCLPGFAAVLDLPQVSIVATQAKLPIEIREVAVQSEVVGLTARSRIAFVLYNPNDRVLEAELQFPLAQEQVVGGFSLDMDGQMRQAVPVPKDRGRQVFEDVSRARIDPALLEKTQGDNYKLRIYPLPARGARRVVLDVDQELVPRLIDGRRLRMFNLPLRFSNRVGKLSVTVNHAGKAGRLRARFGAELLRSAAASSSPLQFERNDYRGDATLRIEYPDQGAAIQVVGSHNDRSYFYAEIPAPRMADLPRAPPARIGLVWDASGSGASRDHGLEFALLEAYFKTLDRVEVVLLLARDKAEPPRRYVVEQGNWRELRVVLESVAYDGGSAATEFSPPPDTGLNLLFTDGLFNYGAGRLNAGKAPLFILNAAMGSDAGYLRSLAESTGGRLLDLRGADASDALHALTQVQPRLVGVRSNTASDLVFASAFADLRRVRLAGVMNDVTADIQLDWLDSSGKALSQKFTVTNTAKSPQGLAAQRWALLKLASLEADAEANQVAIRRLGEQFGLLTSGTSLIVLDRVEDYARYEIEPPPVLRSEYQLILGRTRQTRLLDRQRRLDKVAALYAERFQWWQKSFPKDERPMPRDEKAATSVELTGGPPRVGAGMNPRLALMEASPEAARNAAPADAGGSGPGSVAIRLKKWTPDQPYLPRLRDAAADQRYAIYLDEKQAYANSSAFFLDVADLFFERGETLLGLRILSNLAEMNLENRQLLRILAYRLTQARRVDLAIPVLQKILRLSPDEPQSWRDLGLAYAENGDYQLAVDHLWEVVSGSWDPRFPGIEMIALNELNAVLGAMPPGTKVDTSRVEGRLLQSMPLGMRVILSWDADNTDIDLWVTDPNNEKVYFGHRASYQGGVMSLDFRQGYGPEEFSLRTPKAGTYKVQAHYYGNTQQVIAGATTIMLRFSTAFGASGQKDENVILRLGAQGADVEVGSFEVRSAAP